MVSNPRTNLKKNDIYTGRVNYKKLVKSKDRGLDIQLIPVGDQVVAYLYNFSYTKKSLDWRNWITSSKYAYNYTWSQHDNVVLTLCTESYYNNHGNCYIT